MINWNTTRLLSKYFQIFIRTHSAPIRIIYIIFFLTADKLWTSNDVQSRMSKSCPLNEFCLSSRMPLTQSTILTMQMYCGCNSKTCILYNNSAIIFRYIINSLSSSVLHTMIFLTISFRRNSVIRRLLIEDLFHCCRSCLDRIQGIDLVGWSNP